MAKKKAKKKVVKKKVLTKKKVKKVTPKSKPKKKVKAKAKRKIVKKKKVLAKKPIEKKLKAKPEKVVKEIKVKEEKLPKKKTAAQLLQEAKEILQLPLSEIKKDLGLNEIFESMKSLDVFDSTSDECLEKDCDNLATTNGFCRLHYIKNWGEIKNREEIILHGRLNEVIVLVLSKIPLKFISDILEDIQDDKSFYKVLKELNIDTKGEGFEEGEEEDFDDERDIAYETKGTIKTLVETE
jgi:hypothetical protein